MKKKMRPKGREEVMASILETAASLFAKHGVEAVSIRAIAQKAKVNHGLIHRHFKSKENLRLEVQDYLASQVREEIGNPDSAVDIVMNTLAAIRKHENFWRVLARTFLDEKFKGDVQSGFPFIRALVELVRAEQQKGTVIDNIDPRIIVIGFCAMGLGLMVFDKYLLPGTGLDDGPPSDHIDKVIFTWIDLITTQSRNEFV